MAYSSQEKGNIKAALKQLLTGLPWGCSNFPVHYNIKKQNRSYMNQKKGTTPKNDSFDVRDRIRTHDLLVRSQKFNCSTMRFIRVEFYRFFTLL